MSDTPDEQVAAAAEAVNALPEGQGGDNEAARVAALNALRAAKAGESA